MLERTLGENNPIVQRACNSVQSIYFEKAFYKKVYIKIYKITAILKGLARETLCEPIGNGIAVYSANLFWSSEIFVPACAPLLHILILFPLLR